MSGYIRDTQKIIDNIIPDEIMYIILSFYFYLTNYQQESDNLQSKIDDTKLQIKTMEIELQTVENREAARKYKPVIRDHRNKLKELEQALQWSAAGAADDVG